MLNSLNSARTGLNTAQVAIENTMNNIANENSQGYVKRVAYQNELNNSDATYANGVGISSIDRQVNEYMALKIQNENSVHSYYSKNSSIFSALEVSFMETDSSGLSSSLNNYFQSIENLRSNPNSDVYKSEVISSANDFIFDIQGIYKDIENMQTSLKEEMHTQVNSVNKLAKEISKINEQILNNPSNLELKDRRDLLINELSTYGNIEVNDEPDYFQIKMTGETIVFNNINNELNVVEDYTSQKNIYDSSLLDDSNIINGDTITLTLNNGDSISVIANTTGAGPTDVKQQLVDAINSNSPMISTVNASLDKDGNLVVESKKEGEESFFDLDIQLDNTKTKVSKNDNLSQIAIDDVHIQILDKKIQFSSGSLKSLDENTSTNNLNNVLHQTQKKLNDLAYSMIDTTKSYVNDNDSYIYGDDKSKSYTGPSSINKTNLFSGSSVMTMDFNEKSVNNLSQKDLDYLSTLQFKDDLNINSSDTNSKQSYRDFLMDTKVSVASTKESVDLKLDTQKSIVMSLQSNYDQISKVDKDEEMINLMQFQSAYEANAKVITAIDEMIQTILKM